MKQVLLVEDEKMLVDLYREAFEDQGFDLSIAENGSDALKMAESTPDLILLDILLPGINGFEVLRQLKGNSKTKNIPVIVLTNLGSEQTDKDKQLALSLGAVDYLVKSYHDPEELLGVIRKHLDLVKEK